MSGWGPWSWAAPQWGAQLWPPSDLAIRAATAAPVVLRTASLGACMLCPCFGQVMVLCHRCCWTLVGRFRIACGAQQGPGTLPKQQHCDPRTQVQLGSTL